MKNYLLLFTILGFLVACTPKLQEKIENQISPLGYKMEEAAAMWNSKKAAKPDGQLDYQKDGTWLDVGIRYKYFVLKDLVNIKLLGEITKTPVYKSGPHKGEVEYRSQTEFGHYNPAFLKKVEQVLDASIKRESFNLVAQKFYDKELKGMARTYYRAYLHVNRNETTTKEIIEKYKSLMVENGGKYDEPGHYLQEKYRGYGSDEEKLGYDWYEASTAPGFWVRRKMDDTTKQFINLLTKVLDKYDPTFKK